MIYAIQVGQSGPIKFGITNNIKRRLSALQNAHFESLQVVATQETADDAAIEKYVHEACQPDRLRGEWFKTSPQVQELIQFIRDGLVEKDGSREYCKRILADYEQAKERAAISQAIYLLTKLKAGLDRRERIERKKRYDAKAREDWQRERRLRLSQN